MDSFQTLWDQYNSLAVNVEKDIIGYFVAGWKPTGGFDETGRSEFDPSIDVARIPMREYPFTHLSSALVPLMVYSLIVMSGIVLLRCRTVAQREKSQRQLIREEYLYPFKFVYNVTQIFLCAYMSVHALVIAKHEGLLNLQCGAFHFEDPKVGELLWLFYVSKILDFMDTVFIIASCKQSQFTFLHTFHHFTIYSVYWLNVNINYDGDIYFTILANGFIHTIMYSYYWISMHIPKVKDEKTNRLKYGIWWKKYLTQMQLIQFLLMMGQALWIVFGAKCTESPPRVTKLYFGYILLMFGLFMWFFKKTYSRRKKKRD